MSRRIARELALQALYQIDIGKAPVLKAVDHVLGEQKISGKNKPFFESLVQGVVDNIQLIDSEISAHLHQWDIKRIASVDRNILRIATYEIIFCEEIPSSVSINEAIELAKVFSSHEAAKFVNGVLDKIEKQKIVEKE